MERKFVQRRSVELSGRVREVGQGERGRREDGCSNPGVVKVGREEKVAQVGEAGER